MRTKTCVVWDKSGLISDRIKTRNKRSKITHSPPTNPCLARPWAAAALETHPQFYCWAWHSMVWDISSACWGQLSWPCPLTPLVPPQWGTPRPGAQREEQKALALCKHCSATTNHQCVIDTVWVTSFKHSTIHTGCCEESSHPTTHLKGRMSLNKQTKLLFYCMAELSEGHRSAKCSGTLLHREVVGWSTAFLDREPPESAVGVSFCASPWNGILH